MLDRQKILSGINAPEEKDSVARCLDLAENTLKYHRTYVSDFYDPFHIALISSALKAIPDISVAYDGGYSDAERKRIIISPDYLDPEREDSELAFLSIEGHFSKLSHRDFLGAILGLGLRREKIGDIYIFKDKAQVVAAREVSDFIRLHLTRVGKSNVNINEIFREDLSPPQPKVKDIQSTVPSMRLDVVAAAAFFTSRGKIAREINAQRVALNWCICTKQSAPVSQGDVLSIRGKGRAVIEEVSGTTKKGRISIRLKRYV